MPAEGRDDDAVIYWDASALLSCLVEDFHTGSAAAVFARPGYHVVSSLAFAEVHAVLSRIARLPGKAEAAESARAAFAQGPWIWLEIGPDRELCRALGTRRALRGADLWHLATALTLRERLPELALLTFDRALGEAALAEGLGGVP
jgi:predicted nucleic acid-binding protein